MTIDIKQQIAEKEMKKQFGDFDGVAPAPFKHMEYMNENGETKEGLLVMIPSPTQKDLNLECVWDLATGKCYGIHLTDNSIPYIMCGKKEEDKEKTDEEE